MRNETIKRPLPRRAVGLGIVLSSLFAVNACSSDKPEPKPTYTTTTTTTETSLPSTASVDVPGFQSIVLCTAIDPAHWEHPTKDAAPQYAQAMMIDVTRIEQGLIGEAECQGGVDQTLVNLGLAGVVVTGINDQSNPCLVTKNFGEQPTSNGPQGHVQAVCPSK